MKSHSRGFSWYLFLLWLLSWEDVSAPNCHLMGDSLSENESNQRNIEPTDLERTHSEDLGSAIDPDASEHRTFWVK